MAHMSFPSPDQPVYLCLVPPTFFIINLPKNAVRSVSPPPLPRLSFLCRPTVLLVSSSRLMLRRTFRICISTKADRYNHGRYRRNCMQDDSQSGPT
jgi:hypothetical protein